MSRGTISPAAPPISPRPPVDASSATDSGLVSPPATCPSPVRTGWRFCSVPVMAASGVTICIRGVSPVASAPVSVCAAASNAGLKAGMPCSNADLIRCQIDGARPALTLMSDGRVEEKDGGLRGASGVGAGRSVVGAGRLLLSGVGVGSADALTGVGAGSVESSGWGAGRVVVAMIYLLARCQPLYCGEVRYWFTRLAATA